MSGIAIVLQNADFSRRGLGSVTPIAPGVDIPITALSISAQYTVIDPGVSELQLYLAFTPTNTTQRDVVWSSSNTSVATINNSGKITVVSRPLSDTAVTFTATSASDSSVTDTISITVKAQQQVIPITGITISSPSAIIDVNTSELQLQAALTPSNTTQTTIVWSSSNTSVATINNSGKITVVSRPLSDTAVTFTATSASDSSVTDTISITVKAQQQSIVMLAFGGAAEDTQVSDPNKIMRFIDAYNNDDTPYRACLLVTGATEHLDGDLIEYRATTKYKNNVNAFKQALTTVGEPLVIKSVRTVVFNFDATKLGAKGIDAISCGIFDITAKRLLNTWQWNTAPVTVNISNESDYSANKKYLVLLNFRATQPTEVISALPEAGVDFDVELIS